MVYITLTSAYVKKKEKKKDIRLFFHCTHVTDAVDLLIEVQRKRKRDLEEYSNEPSYSCVVAQQ